MDVEIQFLAFSCSPVAHPRGLLRQSLEFFEEFTAWNGIGSKTHEVSCLLLAVNELKIMSLKELVQMVERHLGGVGDGVKHRLAEKHLSDG